MIQRSFADDVRAIAHQNLQPFAHIRNACVDASGCCGVVVFFGNVHPAAQVIVGEGLVFGLDHVPVSDGRRPHPSRCKNSLLYEFLVGFLGRIVHHLFNQAEYDVLVIVQLAQGSCRTHPVQTGGNIVQGPVTFYQIRISMVRHPCCVGKQMGNRSIFGMIGRGEFEFRVMFFHSIVPAKLPIFNQHSAQNSSKTFGKGTDSEYRIDVNRVAHP